MQIELWLTKEEACLVASILEREARVRAPEERARAMRGGTLGQESSILGACAISIQHQIDEEV